MTIKALVSRGSSNSAVARLLGVSEGAVRYHVTRMSVGAVDGRGGKAFKAAPLAEVIEHWREAQADAAINLAELHAWLVDEHGYAGTLRSVQRFWAKLRPQRSGRGGGSRRRRARKRRQTGRIFRT